MSGLKPGKYQGPKPDTFTAYSLYSVELKKMQDDKRAGSLFQGELNESHLIFDIQTDSNF